MGIFEKLKHAALMHLIGKSGRATLLTHQEAEQFKRVQMLYEKLWAAGQQKIKISNEIDDLNYAIAQLLSDSDVDAQTNLPILKPKFCGFQTSAVSEKKVLDRAGDKNAQHD
jgi:hypothetical protein